MGWNAPEMSRCTKRIVKVSLDFDERKTTSTLRLHTVAQDPSGFQCPILENITLFSKRNEIFGTFSFF